MSISKINFIFIYAATLAAQATLEPGIASETLPSGGAMQIKMDLASPLPIIAANVRFAMDPAVFDGIEGASVFSPAGDAYGVALLRGGVLVANLASPQRSLGTQTGFPFLVVAARIRPGLPAATRVPIDLSPASAFIGPTGLPYVYSARNGALTIGGSVSVANVIPGSGVLPAGTAVRILGTGFDNQTQLVPGTLSIANFRYAGPMELQFEIAQTAEIAGRRLVVRNPAGNHEAVYFTFPRDSPIGSSSRALLNDAHPIFPAASSFTSAALTLPSAPSGGFLGVALRNASLEPAVVNLQLVSSTGASLGFSSVIVPPGSRYSRSMLELFGAASPPGSVVRVSSLVPIQVLGLKGHELAADVTAFLAETAPPGSIALAAAPASLEFNYRIGGATPAGQSVVFTGVNSGTLAYTVVSHPGWLTVAPINGQTSTPLAVSANPAGLDAGQYSGSIGIDVPGAGSIAIPVSLTVAVAGGGVSSTGLRFVSVTPCRLVDTRLGPGAFGAPALSAGVARAFALPQSSCGIPANAAAYSLNITVVPKGPLGYITLWPTGAAQPFVSTLNSVDGRLKANAAIVPAGTGGAVSVYATGATELIIDINGYFADPAAASVSLAFYPISPCRVADTRSPNGALGGPGLANGSRDFPVLSSACGIPSNAQAVSVNATVVPTGPLGYLTLWPTGQSQPFVSTLNATTGGVVANAAIVPVGTNGSISAYAAGVTHLVVDINGYFAPPGAVNAMKFYAVTPCRLLDTRNAIADLGGPVLEGARSYPVTAASCGLPATARGYSLNATVVPETTLGYLTLWPTGQTQPFVSTLNAIDDKVVANAAIVPAGNGGNVSSYVTNRTHLILDTNGYFAP